MIAGVRKALGLSWCSPGRLLASGCSREGSGKGPALRVGPALFTDWLGLEELRSNRLKPRAPFLGCASFLLILKGLSAESAVPMTCCELAFDSSAGTCCSPGLPLVLLSGCSPIPFRRASYNCDTQNVL